MVKFYDMDGRPISLDDFGQRYPNLEDRRVGFDFIDPEHPDQGYVSTLLIGFDMTRYAATPTSHPSIFETMEFPITPSSVHQRYATKEEAEAGHAKALEEARARRAEAIARLTSVLARPQGET